MHKKVFCNASSCCENTGVILYVCYFNKFLHVVYSKKSSNVLKHFKYFFSKIIFLFHNNNFINKMDFWMANNLDSSSVL